MQVISKIAGESWDFQWTIRNKSDKSAVDLTGYSISFGIKAKAEDTTYIAGPITGSHDSTGGHGYATIPAATTATIPAGVEYIAEFQRTLAGGVVKKKQFKITVSARVITS